VTTFLRNILLTLLATVAFVVPAAAQNATPTMLLGPANWSFERISIPPGFAPDIKWKGFEEARFAPGMFNTSASNYFTYVLAVQVDGTNAITVAELKEFLDKYFRGLSTTIGRRKQIKLDETQFNAVVNAVKAEPDKPRQFEAKQVFFDTFNDGRRIELNLEITVLPKPEAKKTILVLLTTPQAKDAPIWKQLREIQAQADFAVGGSR
jgi:hypothetical protein